MAGGVISPLYTGVKARRNGTPCITPAASAAAMYICAPCKPVDSSPPTRNRDAGTVHVSVYRKLRSGSVKSSALNGTGQTYAETWEIAALGAVHAKVYAALYILIRVRGKYIRRQWRQP